MNTERFTGRVDVYDRYRMRYPAAAIVQTLQEFCGLLPEHIIADIGAGTGMLSEVFLENGNTVYAVEPNAEMRAAALPLLQQYSRLTVVDAAAEATTLPSDSYDMVTAGRAFHWFDRDRAIKEFQRILKPHGWLVLVSASRDKTGSAANRAAEELLSAQSPDREHVGGGHYIHQNAAELFPGMTVQQRALHSETMLTREAWVGQTLSFSSAPLPDSVNYRAFVDALNVLFEEHAEKGLIRVPEVCWITCSLLKT